MAKTMGRKNILAKVAAAASDGIDPRDLSKLKTKEALTWHSPEGCIWRIDATFAVYLRYKSDPSVLFSSAFRSQSRSVCSEVLKWAWLDWSITGFWEHRVKVTRKYSGFCQNRLDLSVQSGSYDRHEICHHILKSPKPLSLILLPISGWWGHKSPRRTGKVNTTVKMLHCPPGCSCLDSAEFSRGSWQCFRLTF